jgi:uncharacterized protein (TIGR02757 family)
MKRRTAKPTTKRRLAPATRRPFTAAEAARLAPLLLRLDATLDRTARLAADPVELPRRYAAAADQEVAGLLAACLAYGRADLFKPILVRLLDQLGPSPAAAVDDIAAGLAAGTGAAGAGPSADGPRVRLLARFAWFRYRFNQPADLAALLAAMGTLRLRHGSLGARFAGLFAEAGGGPSALRPALAAFAGELRQAPPVAALLHGRGGRGLRHLLPDAAGPGAAKRWNLYLRWMVRGPGPVDLGAWPGVPPAALLMPLDTHVHRVARRLGLTRRADAGWRTAEEITAALRLVDPVDPVRNDFALCHLGMSGACPPRLTPAHCAACPLVSGCRCASAAAGPRRRRAPGSGRARSR